MLFTALIAGNVDFISIDIWHIVVAIGNLFILTLILKKFLFKPVQKILKQREDEVNKMYSDADTALAKANEDKQTYEKKLTDAGAQADSIIKTATARAKQESEQIVSAAKSEAQRRLENADADIELAKRKAAAQMKNSVSDMVIDLAEQVVEKEIDAAAHAKLIDEAISGLGDDDEQQ
ncbi:MAG TPA: F0F1 ATP synthase subunit B [Candidatus Faeciplasma gallinarum]|uniref:ATP synthase subunit b n=1 Tax=Candidatus Faeciplasma gallinarum TaxID=2840799 RepID=A0A9D1JHR3_9FIRM|nr:F0F1 ATP synthase subunit B [Candidatus Faeciplasma gallinarum]